MGQALYRKYRTRSLEELVGQEHITNTLARAIQAGRVSHAYLFTGPHGVGKTSVARILAHEINQLPYADTQNLDIIEIDAASNRRIDDIRDLRDKVFITPVSTKYKVYIIDEVHMLTGESFNALLKTLEEPPAHVVFILATTEVHKLPATIVSRTQRFAFRPVERQKVVAHLRHIADKEKIDITDDALGLIADHGEGSFRDSISLLDQLAHATAGQINADAVTAMLGLAPQQQLEALANAIVAGDSTAVTARLSELSTQGITSSTLVGQLNKMLLGMAPVHPHLYQLMDKLLDVPRAYNPDLKLLTVLMLSLGFQPRKAEPKNTPVIATTPTAITIAEAPAIRKPKKTKEIPEAAAPQKTTPATLNTPLTAMDTTQWHTVLGVLKKSSPPLYSVVKQAQPSFDAATHTLTLAFKYQLHRKKVDDPKAKAALAHTIVEALGGAPHISTLVDADAAPPPPLPADPTVAAIANIMGGGEVIDAAAA